MHNLNLQNSEPYYVFNLGSNPPSLADTKCVGHLTTFFRNSDWNSSYCVLIHQDTTTTFFNGHEWERGHLEKLKIEKKHSFMWQKIGRAGKLEYKMEICFLSRYLIYESFQRHSFLHVFNYMLT